MPQHLQGLQRKATVFVHSCLSKTVPPKILKVSQKIHVIFFSHPSPIHAHAREDVPPHFPHFPFWRTGKAFPSIGKMELLIYLLFIHYYYFFFFETSLNANQHRFQGSLCWSFSVHICLTLLSRKCF